MNTESFENILQQLGDEIGIDDLQLNEAATCTLRFDSKHVVIIECPPGGNEIFLYTMLFHLPNKQQKLACLQRFMHANLFGKETGLAYFACNPESNEVFLIRTLELNHLGYDIFRKALEDFLQRLEYWQTLIDNGQIFSEKLTSQNNLPKDDCSFFV